MSSSPLKATPYAGRDGLSKSEFLWREHFAWFKDQGYQLRPRFAPDWIPSWQGTSKAQINCEDGLPLMYTQINDAIHIPTGSRVALKRVYQKSHPYEEDIMRYFSSDRLSKDARNHCIPLLDVLHLPIQDGADEIRILVMPFLRPFDSPPFDTFGEALECIRQLLEGLQFIHEHHVAHRDIKLNNFMIESEKMFPQGHHPHTLRNLRTSDLRGPAKFFTRTQRPSRYFIIDFGLSRQYDPGNHDPLEVIRAADGKTMEQNPFQTDIYLVGELVRQAFLDGHPILTSVRGYRGFEFLRPLINDMVQDDPTRRPKMDEVVKRFEDVVSSLGTWKLRSRTSSRRANVFQDVGHTFSHWKRKVAFVIGGTPAIPVS